MRRPLKPFITEYKGSARRGAPALREPATAESVKSAPKPLDFAFPPDAEDSYEAAMRAADALFSSQRPAPSSPARGREPPPRQIPALESTAVAAVFDAPAAPERPAGRILRVLDEPPLPDDLALAALEAEHAPKRRGRKPGSKNKPKPVVVQEALLNEDVAPVIDIVPIVAREARPAARPTAVRRVAALTAAAVPAGDRTASKRFSWVKDRLRPGEDWKRRRLPKVCW